MTDTPKPLSSAVEQLSRALTSPTHATTALPKREVSLFEVVSDCVTSMRKHAYRCFEDRELHQLLLKRADELEAEALKIVEARRAGERTT